MHRQALIITRLNGESLTAAVDYASPAGSDFNSKTAAHALAHSFVAFTDRNAVIEIRYGR